MSYSVVGQRVPAKADALNDALRSSQGLSEMGGSSIPVFSCPSSNGVDEDPVEVWAFAFKVGTERRRG